MIPTLIQKLILAQLQLETLRLTHILTLINMGMSWIYTWPLKNFVPSILILILFLLRNDFVLVCTAGF